MLVSVFGFDVTEEGYLGTDSRGELCTLVGLRLPLYKILLIDFGLYILGLVRTILSSRTLNIVCEVIDFWTV